jgi:hypothetical protein
MRFSCAAGATRSQGKKDTKMTDCSTKKYILLFLTKQETKSLLHALYGEFVRFARHISVVITFFLSLIVPASYAQPLLQKLKIAFSTISLQMKGCYRGEQVR